MKLLKITLLLLASSVALNVQAGGSSPFYIGATVGVSDVDNDDSGIKEDAGCGNAHYDSDDYHYDKKCSIENDDKDRVGHIYGGFQFTESLSVEAGYVDLGNTADYQYEGQSITQETKGITVAGVARYRVGKASNTSVYGKAGIVGWQSEVELKDEKGHKSGSKEEEGVSPVVGVGVEYDLNHNITLRAGWDRYFDVGEEEHIISHDGHGTRVNTLETDVDVFSAGVNYYFF